MSKVVRSNKLHAFASHLVTLELMKSRLEVFENKTGGVVDLIVKSKTGQYNEVLLQVLNLETTERSVKIPKSEWDYELAENRWIALVLFMREMEPKAYLIPSRMFNEPDEFIFFDNDQGECMKHLSNWEIRIFSKGIEQLSEFGLASSIKKMP